MPENVLPDHPENRPAAEAKVISEPQPPPKPKRRRWGRRIAVILVILIGALASLIAAAPYIASTSAVSGYVLDQVSDRLKGDIRADGISLSWFGTTQVSGLRVVDPEDREVMSVKTVVAPNGVWGLLTSWETLGDVQIDDPRVVLYFNDANELSLIEALSLVHPSPDKPKSDELPQPRGKIELRNGSVRVVRGGAEYEVWAINGYAELATLSDIKAKLDAATADGGKITAEAAIQNLLTDGQLQPENAGGSIRIATASDLKLGPMADLADPSLGLDGSAGFAVDAKIESGQLSATFESDIRGLQTKDRAQAKASPIDVQFKGKVDLSKKRLAAQGDIGGPAGSLNCAVTYGFSGQPLPLSADRLLSAMLTGESITLPDFKLEAQGHVDLAVLGKAVPGLLNIQAGRTITDGKLEIAQLAAQGGSAPKAGGSIVLKDVVAEGAGGKAALQPITLGFDAALQAGRGVEIKNAELKASFAQASATGAASNLRAAFQCDLTRMRQELGQILDLSDLDLAGNVTGNLELSRAGDDRVNVSLQSTANALKYVTQGKRLEVAKANIDQTGYLTLADQRVTRMDIGQLKADLNGEIVASASGWYDLIKQAYHGDLDVKQADLRFLATRAKALGMDELARYSGTVTGKAKIDQAGPSQPIQSSGALTARNLAVDGKPLIEREAQVDWSGLELAPDGRQIRLASAKLDTAPATLNATEFRWQSGPNGATDGKITGSADLAQCLRAAAVFGTSQEPPSIAGKLTFDGTLSTANDVTSVAARGEIDRLEIGSGKDVAREDKVRFALDGKVTQRNHEINLANFNVESAPLKVKLSGTVNKYDSDCVLALDGSYDAAWEPVMALLHQLAPGTADTIMVKGASKGQFRVTGSAAQPGARPEFRGVRTGMDLGWTSAEVLGVEMSGAKLSPALANGQITIPNTKLSASKGNVNLGGRIDFAPPDPTLRIDGKLKVLDKVTITKKLADQLLSRVNPIFMHMTKIQGMVSMDLQNLVLPFGEAIKKLGTGRGNLDLSTITAQPSGLLTELLSLGGLPDTEQYTVQTSAVDFEVKNGRIHYDNLTLAFPGDFDLKFHGSVGFDDTLDLWVSIPVHPPLLERLGVRGPVVEYAKKLAGTRVEIPIVGTRQQPRLDLTKVDTQALLKNVLIDAPGKLIDDLLQGLGGKEKGGKK